MNDIHCHILYGLDDGAVSIEEALEMARIARTGGTKRIIATPHSNVTGSYRNVWCEEFSDMIGRLNTRLRERDVDVEIYPGQEIFCGEGFLNLLLGGELITLNNSKYPLVEFDFYEHSSSVYLKLKKLVSEGYVPVVAHPERYAFAFENSASVLELKNYGALIQLNAQSIIGGFGRYPKLVSEYILKNELADFVASDAHSPYMRTPYLADAHSIISDITSVDYADRVLNVNPSKILKNEKII